MTRRKTFRRILTVLAAVALAAIMFLTGFLFAIERMVSLEGLTSRPITDWFKPQTAIVLDSEAIGPEDTAAFNRVLSLLKTKYYKPVDDQALIDNAIKGVAFGTGDPYTTYFTPEEMTEFIENTSGNYVGIGVSVSMDENSLLTVAEVFADSPADKAGILIGDKIVKVDAEDVTGISDSSLIIAKIKGKAGTDVAVQVYRPSDTEYHDFAMKRAVINTPNITSRVLEDGIGYIRISQFDEDIARGFREEWNKLVSKGAKSLVIDLRYNPGGDYYQVCAIADMLLPEGLIVYTEDRAGRREEQRSDAGGLDVPMAVLVNGYSASASEILSAALQDYGKAVIVGEKTYGKGLVQTIDTKFANGAGLKYTISTYYSPKGRNIQHEGVTPDITIALDETWATTPLAKIPEDKDNQLAVAISEMRKAIGTK